MIGRFINADTTDVLTVSPTSLMDKNLYAYCDNNPVVRRDESGAIWETIFDIASLGASIAEVAANPANPWAWAGLIGDVVDVGLPFVTGVGEAIKGVRTTVRMISNSDEIIDTARAFRRSTEAASEVRNSTGVYVTLFESGKNYVGKGGFNRAIQSAVDHMNGDKVTAILWAPTSSEKNAFISEYLLQSYYGVGRNHKNTYNLIWSPGKNK